MKSLFEQTGGTYRQEGDYLIPNITLSNEENQPIGIWGQRHLRYLKQHRQAENMFYRLVKELAEKENVTEQLKSTDQMVWVQKMNNIRACAMEIVNKEIIYA